MTPGLFLAALLLAPQDSAVNPWAALERYVEERVAARAFPGAVVAVGRRDTVLFLRAFGRLDYGAGSAVTTRTIYDIASLTKVVGLTTGLMMLADEGRLDLDAPASRYVPAFAPSGGDRVTVRHLLTHSSGLPAWRPFFEEARSRERVMALVDAAPLEAPPGTRMVYSDLGAIVLTQVVESVSGRRVDRFLEQRLMRPLGMTETRFRPPARWRARIAPTEDDPWRRRVLRGEVHDENAAAMDGISGHAGLFSTAGDLVKFARFMLAGGRAQPVSNRRTGSADRPPAPLVARATLDEFTRVQNPSLSSRALGWDTPAEGSSAGTHLSPRAYGHTGFTGTSLWIDPAQDLFIVLLTNRVHPTRENTQIFEVRRHVADLAAVAAGAPSPAPRRGP
ncbi:MAG: beta-lactamase family protein [Gemmatimonadetes bacterium]|nr:beta-lactamase family protein [Gemmatimonadota bacterium]